MMLTLRILVGIGLVALLIRQCRKPWGWPGRLLARAMNSGHSALARWGLGHVTIEPGFRILDIGCGGGRVIQTLSALAAQGTVVGVDYSRACVAVSRATNAAGIAAGRVEVQEGSVSALPFPDAAFDLVTAVETHYYWPDLAANVREVLRVLKPGGRFVIIAELYKHRQHDVHSLVMKPLGGVVLTADEHRDLLSAGGYTDVAVETSKLGWICAIGRRPANR